ncbi:unnamed protein product [Sphagnum troendelagicum]|uniref:Uncharacterized protein n=1 Tax=Sphagnum jensenii TaxID=128206 RepID=A0ABP0WGG8_9BRYO
MQVGAGAHPANEMLGNIRYIGSAIAMHRHRAPNRPSIHRLFRIALAPLVHRLSGDEEASSSPRYVVYIWKEGSWPLGEEEENHTYVY